MPASPMKIPFLLLALPLAASCDGGGGTVPDPFAERQIPAELAADVSDAVLAANRFTVDLFRELAAADSGGNLFASPFSVSTALSMTYAGAAGVTQAEMAGVLRYAETQENIHPSYGALIESLDRGSALGGYRLCVANRLWGQDGYAFLEPFLGVCADEYKAGLGTLDFAADPDGSRRTINLWVEEKTENRIRDLLPAGSVTSLTRLVLTNAIYFKGRWENRFDKNATVTSTFLRDGTDAIHVPMMHQEAAFGYARADGVSLLEMDYEGGDLSMLVVLPDAADGLAEMVASLTDERLAAWIAALGKTKVIVDLPRFGFTSSFSLNDVLGGMGMPSAFDPGLADFSGMTGTRELYIQAVVHKAFVLTDEEGTEAAAATGITVGITSVPEYPAFRADHPFLFAIRDKVTGAILFVGRVTDPLSDE